MVTRIVHNSPKLCTFFDLLNIDLSKPKRQHILNLADALLVCEDEKTLAALQRQFIQSPEVSNMADFLCIRPWKAEDISSALRRNQVNWAVAQAAEAYMLALAYAQLLSPRSSALVVIYDDLYRHLKEFNLTELEDFQTYVRKWRKHYRVEDLQTADLADADAFLQQTFGLEGGA